MRVTLYGLQEAMVKWDGHFEDVVTGRLNSEQRDEAQHGEAEE